MANVQNPSQRQTTEQKRAHAAWQAVDSVTSEASKVRGEYGTQARKLAAMIQINGLANTIAFHNSKKSAKKKDGSPTEAALGHKLVVEHLQAWLTPDTDLMNYIMETSTENYRRATAEAIVYAGWLKRFVDAKGWKSSEGD